MVGEALRQHGIGSEVHSVGRNASAMSPLVPWDRRQRAKLDSLIDATYAQFKQASGGQKEKGLLS